MKIENIKNNCTGCTACMTVCPVSCISMSFDDEGFYFPKLDNNKCIKCGRCEDVCHCLSPNRVKINKNTYYGWNKDINKRFESSSGGAFVALAEKIISEGGIVYGAVFDYEKCELRHASSDDVSIKDMLKSKYIESNLNSVFSQIQCNLNRGQYVLFCGTPCEVSGLKKVIKDDKHKLLTCDFICHGVPSAALFTEHLKTVINKHEKLLSVDFRPKEFGWQGKSIQLKIRTNKRIRIRPYNLDTFYYGFMIKNIFLRRCCYNCQYRENHCSDITLADFWGYRDYDSRLNDEKGISLIITNNDVGKRIVEAISNNFELRQIDNKYSDYVYAPRDYSEAFQEREVFYSLISIYGFEKTAQKLYLKNPEFKFAVYCLKKYARSILEIFKKE